jgi:arsenate reductase
MKQKVLFICTHNSARSQIAEAFLKKLFSDRFDVNSAGTHPGKLNPYVVSAMAELDIDISDNQTKNVDEFNGIQFDFVVTVCDSAKSECPFFPGAVKYIHRSFPDPSSFSGTETEIMAKIRKVRDEIKDWIEEAFGPEAKKSDELKIYL